ncbi:MAG: DUF4276 family protein [Methylococcales bacterium]|nr:DUF4276 family protein [Methylococcales bacterium]
MMLIFLLEELSAKALLDVLLPNILPESVQFKCIPHEGKQDLEKSIPRKLKAWKTPDTYFVIMRDKDSADCIKVKQHLMDLCEDSGRDDSLVRIACHELESWFLGDLTAVGQAFGLSKLAAKQQSRKYKQPDNLASASEELAKLVKGYRKVSGAEKIATYLNIKENNSPSFNCFINGVLALAEKNV